MVIKNNREDIITKNLKEDIINLIWNLKEDIITRNLKEDIIVITQSVKEDILNRNLFLFWILIFIRYDYNNKNYKSNYRDRRWYICLMNILIRIFI